MRDFYVLPRPKNTYKKLLTKLNKNKVTHIPYSSESFDLSREEDVERLATELRKENGTEGSLDGTSIKFFTRLDDSISGFEPGLANRGVCDSKYLGDYITEIQNNPNAVYRSIYNQLIRDGYIPRYFSALIKDCHNDPDRARAEMFGCQAANALGVPTAYCFGIKDSSPKSDEYKGEIEDDYFAVASLDFVPQGFEIETFKDMAKSNKLCCVYDSLDKWLKYIDMCLEKRFPDGVDQESRKALRSDFVKSYLFRIALFPDYDFTVYNGGIMIDENTNKFFMIPNFDMEGMMYEHLYKARGNYYKPNRIRMKRLISYCRENFPDELDDFMGRLEAAHNSDFFMDLLDKTLGPTSQVIYQNIHNCCSTMIDSYNNPEIGLKDFIFA